MIAGLVQILLFQGLGELISKFVLTGLPGPVIGLVLLLAWLMLRGNLNPSLALVADGFSQYLGLLFVPAAVGVVLFLPQLKEHAGALIAALVISVVLTIASSAIILKILSGNRKADE
ncbi:MAG: CidA/LrgA family protein [Polynucleobacter sp.]|jgi:putative effector of murein hydrolase LrgA (UPF0299 family)|nr:CidA/LrgA family protein [Polynucleobacter sp.]